MPGAGVAPEALSLGAPCRVTMACGAKARASVVAGAGLWLAEAAIPCRPRHADISRNDLSSAFACGLQRAIVYRLCVPEPAGMLVGACGTAEPVVIAGAMAV